MTKQIRTDITTHDSKWIREGITGGILPRRDSEFRVDFRRTARCKARSLWVENIPDGLKLAQDIAAAWGTKTDGPFIGYSESGQFDVTMRSYDTDEFVPGRTLDFVVIDKYVHGR